MDILRGSAMTSRGGLVLDMFQFADREGFFRRNADGRARFEALLQEVVAGREDIAVRLARKETVRCIGGRRRGSPPVVHVDNEESPTYTVLEIVAQDALGLAASGQPRGLRPRLRRRPRADPTEGQQGDRRVPSHSVGRQVAAAVQTALKADLERLLQEGS